MPANRPSRTEIERKAIEVYGKAMQAVVCMEECAELIVAIANKLQPQSDFTTEIMKIMIEKADLIKWTCKVYRGSIPAIQVLSVVDGDSGPVLEEIADVQIMLDQMKMIFGPTLIEEDAKLTRLAGRLGMMEDDNGETR